MRVFGDGCKDMQVGFYLFAVYTNDVFDLITKKQYIRNEAAIMRCVITGLKHAHTNYNLIP